jgi:hypothetical protein
VRQSDRVPFRRVSVILVTVLLTGSSGMVAPVAADDSGIGFGKSLLRPASPQNPTSLQFGPDGRLYVAQADGAIKVYSVERNGADDYSVSATETITKIRSIPNHDDDGAPAPATTTRLVTGLLVVGTASRPVAYVSSSDPRGGQDTGDTGADTNSGIISRLTWNGSSWSKKDLVRGLPRSEEVHVTNGMQLDRSTHTLFVAQGGNTNMGAPSAGFGLTPEYALSSAVLSIDLSRISPPYDLPTLDDPTRSGSPVDEADPFGGNDGANQARLTANGPVQVYSPGYRNPYDLVLTQAGNLYASDNGPNGGQGGPPVGEGTPNCTNDPSEPGFAGDDTLHLVTEGHYGGHPNPTRGNSANTFGGQSPVPASDPGQCDFQVPGGDRDALTTFDGSTNGIAEYTASNFGGAMKGNLLAAAWDNYVRRIVLDPGGSSVLSNTKLFSAVGIKPLDITTTGDAGPFPGTVWVADHYASAITVFEPNDYGGTMFVCAGTDDPSLDEDGDGYTNADEIDNGTNPCSAGDVPPDFDGDGLSDLADTDDDNDGRDDAKDRFALDRHNGLQTFLPVRLTWDVGAPDPGGILRSGFTGLMSNGVSDYASLFDADTVNVNTASELFNLEQVADGTARGTANDQHDGFQFGVNVRPDIADAFDVHTRIVAPFAGTTPQTGQEMGVFTGDGTQRSYVTLVVNASGVAFFKEISDTVSTRRSASIALPGPDRIDLFLRVDPDLSTVRPSYTVTTDGQTSARKNLGQEVSVPIEWFVRDSGGSVALAIGLSSTSDGPAPPFAANWDFIEAKPH